MLTTHSRRQFLRCDLYVTVGHRAPVRVRVGTLRGPRGAPETADVELLPAGGVCGTKSPGDSPARPTAPAGAELHRALPLPPRQHLWLPGE